MGDVFARCELAELDWGLVLLELPLLLIEFILELRVLGEVFHVVLVVTLVVFTLPLSLIWTETPDRNARSCGN